MRYAYLHGFASSPLARKGLALASLLSEHGITLELPDLRFPCFERTTLSGSLEAFERYVGEASEQWGLIGSSMGGWVAARWASLHPQRAARLLLLCPGFDLAARWPHLVGPEAMSRWERDGALPLPSPTGEEVPVHWELIEDARRQPPSPLPTCPIHIVHGTRDAVVPIASSRQYAHHPWVELTEVEDEHGLHDSLETVGRLAMTFLVR